VLKVLVFTRVSFLLFFLFGLNGCQPLQTPASTPTQLPTGEAPSTPLAPAAVPTTATVSREISLQNAARLAVLDRFGDGVITGKPQISPDCRLLAIPTTLGIDLYNAQDFTYSAQLPVARWPRLAAFSPDASRLVANVNGAVQEWEIDSRKMARELLSPDSSLLVDLAYSPDGQSIAAAFSDGQVVVWKADSGSLAYMFEGRALEFSPDSRTLITLLHPPSDGGPDQVFLYNLDDGSRLRQWNGQRAGFLPGNQMWIEDSGAVRIIDRAGYQTLQALNGSQAAFSPDGQTTALFTAGEVRLLQLKDGATLRSFPGQFSQVFSLLFSPDGQTLAAAGMVPMCQNCLETLSPLALWSVADGSLIRGLEGFESEPWFTFTPDGQALVVTSGSGSLQVVRVADGAPIASFDEYTPGLEGLALSADGRLIAAASGHPHLAAWVWQIEDAGLLWRFDDPLNPGYVTSSNTTFSPDGQILAASGAFWSLSTGQRLTGLSQKMVDALPFLPSSLTYPPDGESMAAGFGQGQLHLWDVAGETLQRKLEVERGEVASLAYSPDGQLLAAVYLAPQPALLVWPVTQGSPRLTLENSTFSQVAFSPDGQALATISNRGELPEGGFVQLWNLADGSLRAQTQVSGATRVAYSPDGTLLAAGSLDGSLSLWDTADGHLLATLPGHTARVSGVAFTPDGQRLLSSSEDGTILVWGIGE